MKKHRRSGVRGDDDILATDSENDINRQISKHEIFPKDNALKERDHRRAKTLVSGKGARVSKDTYDDTDKSGSEEEIDSLDGGGKGREKGREKGMGYKRDSNVSSRLHSKYSTGQNSPRHFSSRISEESETKSLGGTFSLQSHNLKKLDEIKSKINSGLANAAGSKNSRIIKNTLDLMKNPIISAIKKTLKLNTKGGKSMPKEYSIAMVPPKIFELMDAIMQEKVWVDIEAETGPIEGRAAVPFHTFMYDVVLMRYGL